VCGSLNVAAGSSAFSSISDEAAATKLAETIDLKTLSSADFNFLIKERRWLSSTHVLLTRVQESPLDFSASVRSAVTSVRKELDDLIRALDKKYDDTSLISPAFKWAQNSSHVFLQVKFARRWNAPGALEVHNSSTVVSDCCFSFKGFGEHSMIKKEYKLFLQFLDKVDEAGSTWHMAAAGRLTVTIKKARARKWERLLRSENVAPENMGIWIDMQEKWKSELAGLEGGKKSKEKRKKDDDDDEDEDDEDEASKCETGIFVDSKVTELCPSNFASGKNSKKTLAVMFYSPTSTTKQAQSLGNMWRVLSDMVRTYNKDAVVGAVDCARYKAFCDEKKANKLPHIARFMPGASEGAVFTKEPLLEDLVAWAAGVAAPSSTKRKRGKKAGKEL
jgi:hypothetical protein